MLPAVAVKSVFSPSNATDNRNLACYDGVV